MREEHRKEEAYVERCYVILKIDEFGSYLEGDKRLLGMFGQEEGLHWRLEGLEQARTGRNYLGRRGRRSSRESQQRQDDPGGRWGRPEVLAEDVGGAMEDGGGDRVWGVCTSK